MEQKIINEIFDKLDKWRNYPAYQLERRADIYFAVYLKEILKNEFNTEIDFVVPEFPIRIGTIKKGIDINKSFKVDYLAYSKENNTAFLVELKTDINSKNEKQIEYLNEAHAANIKKLIDGLIKIYNASTSKVKYTNYLMEFEKLGWISFIDKVPKNTSKDCTLKIVYIQPTDDRKDKINTTITFDKVIECLKNKDDFVTKRFVESLKKWKLDPNKEIV